ncbi:hypothetical protein M422DRAFT_262086 [Sphaerobolus stellatus SS14]|uniref:Uncharacterized protein n=1 Tax=Sphaerobolus stellatus (strain SS14) TaxID=990650 RepID=A0A0C9VDK6_SPHS4|nr:hypothetical protein M422DRAFT_262086 [Sphaerobolus stellatus SS14]
MPQPLQIDLIQLNKDSQRRQQQAMQAKKQPTSVSTLKQCGTHTTKATLDTNMQERATRTRSADGIIKDNKDNYQPDEEIDESGSEKEDTTITFHGATYEDDDAPVKAKTHINK